MSLAGLASGPPLDAVIIGGGINGCAIAEEASARGLRVALFEQDDFGFGTTWRSTKLIHGGLRYLEHGDIGLVFESLRERAWLLRTRRHLVRPQRFVLPVLPWTRRPRWQLHAGLTLYDLLAYEHSVPGHGRLSERQLREQAPYLVEGTRGGFTFYDARVLAPERLVLELAMQAAASGAAVHNHARVRRIVVDGGRVTGVEVETGEGWATVPARTVINAAGPWVDAVNLLAGSPPAELLGVTRGTHIAVELERPLPRDAVFSTARSDGRVFFGVPQGRLLLIGTTDVRFDGQPGAVRPTPEDIEYLLMEAEGLFPALGVTRASVRYAYAGLRPLQRVAGGPEAAISRRHTVVDHGKGGGPEGLYSIVGGKLSTFRPLAREVVGRLSPPRRRVGLGERRVALREQAWTMALLGAELDAPLRAHLRIYGAAIPAILDRGRDVICVHGPALAGEVAQAAEHEMCGTLSDILLRRTSIGWGACRGLCCAEAAAAIAAPVLGWPAEEAARQVEAFRADVAYHLPLPGEL